MLATLHLALEQLKLLAQSSDGFTLLLVVPFFLLLELPLTLLIILGVIRRSRHKLQQVPRSDRYFPRVSCIIACYKEGTGVQTTLQTLCEQAYPGVIELIPVIDGAAQNQETLQAIRDFRFDARLYPNRSLRPLAKWQRGGRVSSLNAGLQAATGDIVLVLDGDTSFDNGTISALMRHFEDPSVPAVAGNLRVRNATSSLATRLQELEYFLSIQTSKTGLSEWNTVNNISGAFGAFRKDFIEQIGGWDTHTAEDLDLTLRIKSYFGRHDLRIPFEPEATGHTDVPVSLRAFFMQRLRWDGDLYFLYMRKHFQNMSPRLLGWRNFLMILYSGLFFQLVLPFIIVGSTVAAFALLPLSTVLMLAMLVYTLYLVMTLLLYLTGWLLVSERRKRDLRMLVVIPLFPLFMYFLRCWGVVCTINEAWRRSHEETGMAPWWVLKRGKKF